MDFDGRRLHISRSLKAARFGMVLIVDAHGMGQFLLYRITDNAGAGDGQCG